MYGKATENSLGEPQIGWSGASRNHQGEANSVSQVDGDSDMAPTGGLCGSVGGGLRKEIVVSASTSV